MPRSIPQLSLSDFDERFRDRHLLHGVVEKWSRERPAQPAIIAADTGEVLSWTEFNAVTRALAAHLLELGYRKGDRFVTVLPFTIDQLILEYACFRLGIVFAPLDLRLPPAEIARAVELLRPRGAAFAGAVPPELACTPVEHWLQFADGEAEGGISFRQMLERARSLPQAAHQVLDAASASVVADDGALVIFTTGSTGSPKPALLSHRNIACQAMCISQALFEGDSGKRTLVNLPASHVGGQTELLMGSLFGGGTAVILGAFDPARSLRAIGEYRVQVVGQIPAMFQFEWRLKDYERCDLSSLDFVAYGGQQVSAAFMAKMATMTPWVGTGLGLTESAGFCTYQLQPSERADECLASLGVAMPVYPVSIRGEMQADGSAGGELPDGEIGHICFCGPQTFLGYLSADGIDQEATAKTISRDGYLHTGDLGFKDRLGLHLAGRAKWVIKSFGYQVFPGDVEAHFCALDTVASCAVVGTKHEVIAEAIVAFVEKKAGAELSRAALEKHARELVSYMRPRHYILLEPGTMPLNRAAKADYVRLLQVAETEVEELRREGRWKR